MKITLSLILLTLTAVSCVSTTTIKATDRKGNIDKDVKIYVEGKHIGNGEVKYSDTKTVYSNVPYMELKKEGCKNQREKLDTKTNLLTTFGGRILAGVSLVIMSSSQALEAKDALFYSFPIFIAGLIPLFWTRQYVPIQEQEFQCLKISKDE